MNRASITACALLAFCLPAFAEEATVTVVGTSSTRLTPDQVTWQITAIDEAATLAEARKWSDRRVNQLVKSIEAFGIQADEIRKSPLQMQKKYSRTGESRRIIGYRVRRVISFRQTSLDRFDEILEKLGSRDTAHEEIDFRYLSSQRAEMDKQVLHNAIDVARSRAGRAASAAGGLVGRLIEVREIPCDSSEPEEGIDTGSLILRARVEARFLLRE